MCVARTCRRKAKIQRQTKQSRRFFATRHRATTAPVIAKKPGGKK